MEKNGSKIAVVLFNLGGPDKLSSVRPFLYNLFSDKYIIGIVSPIRQVLAFIIVFIRKKKSEKRYALMGEKSPILQNTLFQAKALEKELEKSGNYKCFVAMRYWHPFIKDVCEDMKKYNPSVIVKLPLYPQFSHTTTASAFNEFDKRMKSFAQVKNIDSYPTEGGFILALVESTRIKYKEAENFGHPRILLVAHGLPVNNIHKGDPYKFQCEQTAKAVINALNISEIDWVLCYQSRVGLKKWITPYFEDEITRAGKEKVPLVITPISFVSENLETLVEIEIEGRERAKLAGAPFFSVAPTVGVSPDFILGLARLVKKVATESR